MSALSVEQLIRGCGHDYRKIFGGFLGIKAGIKKPVEVNVIAQELAATEGNPGKVIDAFAKVYGMSTSDLAVTTEALVHQLVKQFPQPRHRKLTKFIEAADFRKNHILSACEGVQPASSYQEAQIIPISVISELEHETAQVQRFPTRVIVPYEVIRNQTDWINTIPGAILSSLFREESGALHFGVKVVNSSNIRHNDPSGFPDIFLNPA